MNTREARMRREHGPHIIGELGPPLGIVQPDFSSIWPSDPRHDLETGEFVQKTLDLFGIHRGKFPMQFNRAKMRKNICDVMPPKFVSQLPDLRWIAKAGDLVRIFVSNEPAIRSQPAVSNPNAVLSQVMPAIAHVQSR
jgi:hypothetical protein